jgi:hypothetical protein
MRCGQNPSALREKVTPMGSSAGTSAERLLALLSLLQSKPRWNAAELAERLRSTAGPCDATSPGCATSGIRSSPNPAPTAGTSSAPAARCRRCCSRTTRPSPVAIGLRAAAGGGVAGLDDAAVTALAEARAGAAGAAAGAGALAAPGHRRARSGGSRVRASRSCCSRWPRAAGGSSGSASPTATARGTRPSAGSSPTAWCTPGSGGTCRLRPRPRRGVANVPRRPGARRRAHRAPVHAGERARRGGDGRRGPGGRRPPLAGGGAPARRPRRGGRRDPAHGGHHRADGDQALLRIGADDLDWIARYLAGSPFEFEVRHPPELRAELRALGRRLQQRHPSARRQRPRS